MTTVRLVLPLPDRNRCLQLEQLFPLDMMPGSVHDLILCAVEHQDSRDQFIMSVYSIVQRQTDALPEHRADVINGWLSDPEWLQKTTAYLLIFYAEYLQQLKMLFGAEKWELSDVLDPWSGNGVLVLLEKSDG